jgi:hypothetical protein
MLQTIGHQICPGCLAKIQRSGPCSRDFLPDLVGYWNLMVSTIKAINEGDFAQPS